MDRKVYSFQIYNRATLVAKDSFVGSFLHYKIKHTAPSRGVPTHYTSTMTSNKPDTLALMIYRTLERVQSQRIIYLAIVF